MTDEKKPPPLGWCVTCGIDLPYRPGPRARYCAEHNPKSPRCVHGVATGTPCVGCISTSLLQRRLPVAGQGGDPDAESSREEQIAETRALFKRQISEVRGRRELPRELRDEVIADLRETREDWIADVREDFRGR